jgi:hypothetical protein
MLRSKLVLLRIASAATGVSAWSSPSLPEQLGTSTFVLAEIRAADGNQVAAL